MLQAASAAVNGLPSCQVTPRRIFSVYEVKLLFAVHDVRNGSGF